MLKRKGLKAFCSIYYHAAYEFKTQPLVVVEVVVRGGGGGGGGGGGEFNTDSFMHMYFFLFQKGKAFWKLANSKITDPDIGDKHAYSLDKGPNSTFFAFNPISNELTFAVDYDTRIMPNHVILTIRVTDRGGLSGTAQVEVNIKSINKPPVIKNLPQFLLIPETTPVLTVVFTVGAFDPDPRDVLVYKARFLNTNTPLKFLLNQTSKSVNSQVFWFTMKVKESNK